MLALETELTNRRLSVRCRVADLTEGTMTDDLDGSTRAIWRQVTVYVLQLKMETVAAEGADRVGGWVRIGPYWSVLVRVGPYWSFLKLPHRS